MSEPKGSSRRNFLKGAALASGAVLSTPSTSAAQPASQRVYGSGETIDDDVGQFGLEGWDIVFPDETIGDYEEETGRHVEVFLRGTNVEGRASSRSVFPQFLLERDGVKYQTLTAFPITLDDRAFLTIREREHTSGDIESSQILAERSYPIGLSFHTLGESARLRITGGYPNGHIGLFSEASMSEDTMAELFEMYNDFRGLHSAPVVYVRDRDGEDPRLEEFGRDPTEPIATSYPFSSVVVPSFILTDPNFTFRNKGMAMIYRAMAKNLARADSRYGHPDPILKAEMIAAHEELMDAAGYDRDRFEAARGRDSALSDELRDYFNEIVESPLLNVFDADAHLSRLDSRSNAREHGKRMYHDANDFFASVLTVARFNPARDYGGAYGKSALEMLEELEPDQSRLVARAGQSVLDYLGSFKDPNVEGQLKIERALPGYRVLREDLARRAA